jgi:hypothetical protein
MTTEGRAVSVSMQIKHSQLEHSDYKELCCIGVQANQTQPTGTQ